MFSYNIFSSLTKCDVTIVNHNNKLRKTAAMICSSRLINQETRFQVASGQQFWPALVSTGVDDQQLERQESMYAH